MAMTYQQADVDSASMGPTEEEEEEEEEEGEPGFERASHSFRSSGQAQSDDPKTPFHRHSGLSALIEAATAQLSGMEEEESGTCGEDGHHNNHKAAASASFHLGSRSQDHETPTLSSNSGSKAGAPSTGSSLLSTPRFTAHGFHTSVTNTITSTSNDCEAAAALLGSPSLLTTPPLGPEAAAAAAANTQDVRQQTFPEILMTLLEDKTNANVIAFLPDGKFFAVRRKEFSERAMMNYFSVGTFEEFLKKIHSWGFSRIIDHQKVVPEGCNSSSSNDPASTSQQQQQSRRSGIEIFRHPMFIKGDWEKCSRICFGESPTDARLSALPGRARIEYTLSDEATLTTSKRRLSPSHTASEISLPKQRLIFSSGIKPPLNQATETDGGGDQVPTISKIDSNDTSSTDASAAIDATHNQIKRNGLHNDLKLDHSSSSEMIVTCKTSRSNSVVSYKNKTEDDDVRSLALAITTEKLNLKTPDDVEEHAEAATPLVERAVENATRTIVTDAIETLLRDEDHSRETYLKHAKELGRSSLPGVVTITKQLFSAPRSPEGVTAADLEAAEALAISSSSAAVTKCNGDQSQEEQKPDPSESDAVVGMDAGIKTRSRNSRGLQSPGLKTTELEEKGVAKSITSSSI